MSNFPRPNTSRRLVAVGLVTAGLAAGFLAPASAHVRVCPDSTASGSFSALTFRVPNESATASTTKLSVTLPQQSPFLFVSAKPVPGWTIRQQKAALPKPVKTEGTTITEAVRTVTWSTTSAAIAPGQYQEFSLSVGPLPQPGDVVLPATQTYSDGKVVRWNQPTAAGGEEPEYPAPTLTVTATEAPAPAETTATTARDTTSRILGGSGLAVGLAGLAVGLLALRRPTGTGGPKA